MSVPPGKNGNAVVPMELMGIWAKIGAPSHFLQPLRSWAVPLSLLIERKKGMWLPLKLMRKVDKPSPLQNLLLQPKRFPSSKNIPTIPSAQRLSNPSFFVSASNMSYASPAFPAPPRPASQASSAAIAAVVVTNQKVPFLSNHLKTSTTLYVSAYVSSRGKTFVHKHLTMFSHWAASPVPNTKDNRAATLSRVDYFQPV